MSKRLELVNNLELRLYIFVFKVYLHVLKTIVVVQP